MTAPLPRHIAKDPVLKHIYQEVWVNKMNQIILVNGLPRTGKSELCLRLGEALDPKFSVKNIVWKYKDLLNKIKDSKRIGEVIMWDEAGIAEWGINARTFWSEGNISASTLFQTMGFKRNIVLINLPMKMMLDKHVRSLIHVEIETKGVDMHLKKCRSKVVFIEPAFNWKNDVLTKFPRFFYKGVKYKLNQKYWNRASKPLRVDYIRESNKLKQILQEKLIHDAKVKRLAEEKKAMKKDLESLYNEVVKRKDEFWDDDKGGFDVLTVRLKLGISNQMAKDACTLAERDCG